MSFEKKTVTDENIDTFVVLQKFDKNESQWPMFFALMIIDGNLLNDFKLNSIIFGSGINFQVFLRIIKVKWTNIWQFYIHFCVEQPKVT